MQGQAVRFAVAGPVPEQLTTVGDVIPMESMGLEYDRVLMSGNVVVVEDAWAEAVALLGTDLARRMVPDRRSRALAVFFGARGRALGSVTVWQDRSRVLDPEDPEILREIVSRGGWPSTTPAATRAPADR